MGSITTKVKIGDEDENVINPMRDETGHNILEALGGGYGLYAALYDGTDTYVCYQDKNDRWMITKINNATGLVTYAKGDSDTATAWSNRLSQTYADYSTTF